jgi:hypothetical protein
MQNTMSDLRRKSSIKIFLYAAVRLASRLLGVGAGETRWRHLEADWPGCLQVDDEVELGRLFDRNIGDLWRRKTLEANRRKSFGAASQVQCIMNEQT